MQLNQSVDKIHPFTKIAVTFETIQQFNALQDLESLQKCQHCLFYDLKHHFEPFWRDGAVKITKGSLSYSVNELMNAKGICRAAPGFARVF